MASRSPIRLPIFTGSSANGVGIGRLIQDFKNVQLLLATSGSAALVIKVQGSLADPGSEPDWSSAASVTNPWDYVAVYDYQNPSSIINGDTGITFSGTDDVLNLLANIDGLVWLNMEISGYSAGEVTATAVAYNNQ